ncbi:Lnb N-terminal periplasmic domain-containing protein [Aureliella helgolandensis]|uniref:Lnb N-terminal periplasmic domain-containing protein n=1 Tax=Aureliella helgolandensis TaxID=2527968 RepID=UPI0018D1EF7E|nr:DUF4105 domain-containing protein [Aureliella helgolandensis]
MKPRDDDRSALAKLAANPVTYIVEDLRSRLPAKEPTHARLWRSDLAVLPYAEIESDRVVLHNIRDCEYRTEEDYDVRHFDRQVFLKDVQSLDFIVVPFKNTPALAHTMLSFGLADGQHLVFSAEARLEQHETYSAVASASKEFELMWIVGTERDLVRLRTEVRNVDVYIYPLKISPVQAQSVFLGAVARVNAIARTPEFYDLLTNNCTTNIVDMVNSLKPDAIPSDIRVLLPGHSDRLAYDLGLLAMPGTFEQVKAASRINLAAHLNAQDPNFSQAIRQSRR